MKLRTDSTGKPYVVLETPDISCLERAAGLLGSASVIVGEFPSGNAMETAEAIREVLRGEVPGIALPKKRAAKQTGLAAAAETGAPQLWANANAAAAIETFGDPPDNGRVAANDAPRCPECHEVLTAAELRAKREICYVCRPVKEGAA